MTSKEDKVNKKIEKELEKLEKERDEYLQGWQRARADFTNYKKNEKSRILSAQKREKRKIFLDLLEIIDNFELAENNLESEDLKNNKIVGLLNIKKQLLGLLKSYGIDPLEVEGEEFDPNIHEAVAMIDSESEADRVAEEVRKGYLINGELLRPARVKVTKN